VPHISPSHHHPVRAVTFPRLSSFNATNQTKRHAQTLLTGAAPIANRIWTYPSPNPTFSSIKDHVSFYADTGARGSDEERQWDCYVDGEKVAAQPGDFYGLAPPCRGRCLTCLVGRSLYADARCFLGGWVTSEIDTKWVKGAPGTRGW